MRVLVTGSHGFIGSQLVKALKERGDKVDERDLKIKKDLFGPYTQNYDEIYHLACVNQEEALLKPGANLFVNAQAAKDLANIAHGMGARFVYTSTASVYGNATVLPIPSISGEDPKSDYAVAKLAGEHFLRNSGADWTIFRLSNVYGPGQSTDNPYCGVVAKFLEAARAGEPLKVIGDGSQTRDFTYVEDILPHLMNPELKGVLNCSSGVETSVNQLWTEIHMLIPEIERSMTVEFVPERPVDGIQRRVLLSDVNCPTGLPEGLQRTLEWMDAQEKERSVRVAAGVVEKLW